MKFVEVGVLQREYNLQKVNPCETETCEKHFISAHKVLV